jgi:hypothetical protein
LVVLIISDGLSILGVKSQNCPCPKNTILYIFHGSEHGRSPSPVASQRQGRSRGQRLPAPTSAVSLWQTRAIAKEGGREAAGGHGGGWVRLRADAVEGDGRTRGSSTQYGRAWARQTVGGSGVTGGAARGRTPSAATDERSGGLECRVRQEGRCGNLFAFLEKRGGSQLSYRSTGGNYPGVTFQRRELRSKVFGGFISIIWLII